MKIKLRLICLLLLVANLGFAQEQNLGKLRRKAAVLSLGVGMRNPSNTTLNGANLSKSTGFNANLFVPFFGKGGNNRYFNVGINAGASVFNGQETNPTTAGYTPYQIVGQAVAPTLAVVGTQKHNGLLFEAGPQANFNLGGFVISPKLNFGYTNLTQSEYSIVQTTDLATSKTPLVTTLFSQPEAKTSGTTIIPALRLSYTFGNIGLWAEGRALKGPIIFTSSSKLVPAGNPDTKGQYLAAQLATPRATIQTSTQSVDLSSFGFNAGLSIAIGGGGRPKQPGKDYVVQHSHSNAIEVQNPPKKPRKKTNDVQEVVKQNSHSNATEKEWNGVSTKNVQNPETKCVTIQSPENGNRVNKKDWDGLIKGKVIDNVEKVNVQLVKLSDDVNLFQNASTEMRKKLFSDNFTSGKSNFLKENSKLKEVLNKDIAVQGKNLKIQLDKNDLSEGTYKLIASSNNGCQTTETTFSVTSDDCDVHLTLSNITDECKGDWVAGTNGQQGGFIHRICFTSTYSSSNCDLNYANTTSGLKIYDAAMNNLPFTQVTGFPLATQTHGSTTTNNYCVDVKIPSSSANAIIALQGDNCPGMVVTCTPAAQKTFEVKNCACQPCEANHVVASNTGIVSVGSTGIRIINNIIAGPAKIMKIQADLVYVSVTPNNKECVKCDRESNEQGNFVKGEQLIPSLFDNTGKGTFEGQNSNHEIARTVTFTSASGVDITAGANIIHNIGIAPTSCCGDEVEIWIRYTVWDINCKVCDKLVKTKIARKGSCDALPTDNGGPHKDDTDTVTPIKK